MKYACEKCNDTGRSHIGTTSAGERVFSDYLDCSCDAAGERALLNHFIGELRRDYKGDRWPEHMAWAIHQRAKAESAERIAELERQVTELRSDDTRDRVRDAIAAALDEAMDCTRCWSAWGHQTMGPGDFSVVANDDGRLEEIVDAALGVILAAKEQA